MGAGIWCFALMYLIVAMLFIRWVNNRPDYFTSFQWQEIVLLNQINWIGIENNLIQFFAILLWWIVWPLAVIHFYQERRKKEKKMDTKIDTKLSLFNFSKLTFDTLDVGDWFVLSTNQSTALWFIKVRDDFLDYAINLKRGTRFNFSPFLRVWRLKAVTLSGILE